MKFPLHCSTIEHPLSPEIPKLVLLKVANFRVVTFKLNWVCLHTQKNLKKILTIKSWLKCKLEVLWCEGIWYWRKFKFCHRFQMKYWLYSMKFLTCREILTPTLSSAYFYSKWFLWNTFSHFIFQPKEMREVHTDREKILTGKIIQNRRWVGG